MPLFRPPPLPPHTRVNITSHNRDCVYSFYCSSRRLA